MIKRKFSDLSRRDLLVTIISAILLTVAVFAIALHFVEPAPPNTIVMSTGATEGGYHMFAQRYREILARDGVTLELRPSAGSQQNVSRLLDRQSGIEVGFLQAGSAFAVNAPHLVALGSIYYEPLWVFYRGARIDDFDGLRGKIFKREK